MTWPSSLDVPESSDRVTQEKQFIEATSRLCSFNLMSRPGIPISPIEIRLTKDRLSLVSRVLSSNNDAYKHSEVILDLVRKLGFHNDIIAEVKTALFSPSSSSLGMLLSVLRVTRSTTRRLTAASA